METERFARERQFHDERFAAEPRRADSFYSVNTACAERYEGLLASATAGQRVLEYGCGTGSEAFALAHRHVVVTGIDISGVAIEQARDRARREQLDTVSFAEMNAECLAFPDGRFDLVCGSGILHHLDVDRAAEEVERVLANGGRAVFVEPMGHNPLVNLYRRLTPNERTEDEHPFRVDDFDRLRRRFGRVHVEHYVLVALLAIPLSKVRGFHRVLEWCNRADTWLFERLPSLRRYCWTVVIELGDPRRVGSRTPPPDR